MTTSAKSDPIRLRPHHLACLRHFVGEGYSADFTACMTRLKTLLDSAPETPVVLIPAADVLCAACPHHTDGVCESQTKVERLDAEWLTAFALPTGVPMRFGSAAHAAEERLSEDETFRRVCGACEWYALCLNIREKLKKEYKNRLDKRL